MAACLGYCDAEKSTYCQPHAYLMALHVRSKLEFSAFIVHHPRFPQNLVNSFKEKNYKYFFKNKQTNKTKTLAWLETVENAAL